MSDRREGAGGARSRSPDERPRRNERATDGTPSNGVPEEAVPEEAPIRPGEAGEADAMSATRIDELEDRWRRALADLDNFRKRTAGVMEREIAAERARTSAAWLPVLDDLERALEHADAEPGAVIQGVRTVLDQARQVVERLGYPRRDDEGEPFDPALHEAIGTVPGTGAAEGTIVRVVRPGYGTGPTPLRPAQVLVAKGQDDGPGP